MATQASFESSPPPELAVVSNDRPVAERAVLATVALGTMLAPLNSTMIAVALPRVIDEFGTDLATAGWLVTAYLIAMASLQPVAGKLGDRLGRRRLMLIGLLYFGVASFGAAMATSFPMLLAFRLQQAIAGALALPNGTALVREIVPAERRAAQVGLVGAAIALAAAGGPPLGGALVGLAGWRAIFTVNLLLVMPAVLIGWRALPRRPGRNTGKPFDLGGVALLSTLLVGTAGLLIQGQRLGSALVPFGAVALAGLVVFFLRRELRHPDPVLQPRFFARRAFASANAVIAFSNLAMYSTLLAIPLLLSRRAGWTSVQVGLVLAALSAAMVVLAPVGGRLADRYGRRWPTVAGHVVLTAGLVPLALAGGGIELIPLLAGLGLAGVGLGIASAGLQTAAIEAVDAEDAGVASGVFSTSRYLGSIVGSSVLASLISPTSDGFGTLFLLVLGSAVVATLVSLGLRDRAG